MKRSILLAAAAVVAISSHAFAADAVVETPVGDAATWTGLYFGGFAGGSFGDTDFEAGPSGGPTLLGLSVSASGFTGGGQIGYDWQVDNFVFGAVADIAFSDYKAKVSAEIIPFGSGEAESKLQYLGTVRGRLGYAWDRALIYGHGGLAYGKSEQTISFNGNEIYSGSKTRTGWTVGAGIEYKLTDHVSFGTEYAYVDLGNKSIYDDGDTFVNEDLKFHTIKALVNYRF
ncbi:outer membrane protein [Mesorhizobium sp.]|jgi:outer membrane immunogenic protein|uniref:outer membrane protein n=1 Tax=Mesorhizobium sp. TaxID=1871066 RepID=UPI00356978D0